MPQRERISLDGTWEFRMNAENQEPIKVPVPAPWQVVGELRDFTGPGWYSREFEILSTWMEDSRIILGFGAVDYFAEVWVNDDKAAEHEGGYLPFEVDITSLLKPGKNTLQVKVSDPPEIFAEIPHGKQSWYGRLSGIWQPVWLEKRSPVHIMHLKITPELTGRVDVELRLNEELEVGSWLKADIQGPINQEDVGITIPVVAEVLANSTQFEMKVDLPEFWSVDSPHLYRLRVSLLGPSGNVLDEVEDLFGFRTFTAKDGKLWLNGQPFYLRAALDQDYYPDLICTPPSQEYIEAEFRQAKAMGLNCLRVHIKVADPRYYRTADKVGLLIWSELPNCKVLTSNSRLRLSATLQGMVERDWNHPSLVIWTVINESWGIDLTDADQRQWLLETYNMIKGLDPQRLVVDNSPCIPNFHIKTDLEDYHHYRQIPDHRRDWDQFIEEFSRRPPWTFSDYGDAARTGEEPLILSEFGNWGLPDVERLEQAGSEPWWFETGYNWSEVVYPHGLKRRFFDYHFDKVFSSFQDFIHATQQQQFQSLKYEIECLQRQPSISGYVITEFTDVHWECNGLLDMRRNPKSFADNLRSFISDIILIPRGERTAYWGGEKIEIDLLLAHTGSDPIPAGVVNWQFTGTITGQLDMPQIAAGQVVTLGKVTFTAPDVDVAIQEDLHLNYFSAEGDHLTSNSISILVFPSHRELSTAPSVWCEDADWSERLISLGYTLARDAQSAGLVISSRLDIASLDTLRAGARMLLCIESSGDIVVDSLGLGVQERTGSVWQGDWVSTFTWLRRTGPLARLPGGSLLDLAYEGVIPSVVLTGFRQHEFESDVLGGTCVGWLHKNVAILAKGHYSKSQYLVTTFRLKEATPRADPVAITLLDALIAYAGSL